MISFSSARRARLGVSLFIAASALSARPARAELVEIQWDPSGGFERSLTVAPGKFAEVCGKLATGQSIAWSFKGRQPMNFNIHYHEGKSVVFPAKQDEVASLDGTLNVPLAHDYCWMWENKSATAASVQLTLRKR